jgi:hypothetical protein
MSTPTTRRQTGAGALRFALGTAERPADVCPTIGTALQQLTAPSSPLLPGGMSAQQLEAVLDDSHGGDDVTARRMWRIASYLSGDVVPRWLNHLGAWAPTTDPPPALRSAAATAQVLEQLTRTTHQLQPVRSASRGTVRGAMRTAGFAALLRGAAHDPVLVPLATAVAGAAGELLARTAGALIPEEAHQHAMHEHERTLAFVMTLPTITPKDTQ